ncbi:hypothetical protein GQ53DRAFT_424548 [Thozetella sp. PMI_491]|nr:hypothetical protein GQ53DRAFT_424548 [Thozetella sp. PMI_491]
MRRHGTSILCVVTGQAYSIAECGEQLSWLVTSFASFTTGIAVYSTPTVEDTSDLNLEEIAPPHNSPTALFHAEPKSWSAFNVNTQTEEINPLSTHGAFWQKLLGSPMPTTVARGFPLVPQPDGCQGLEIPFDILVKVAAMQDFSTTGGSIRILGSRFSLQLTHHANSVFYWREPLHGWFRRFYSGLGATDICSSPRWSDIPGFDTGRHIICAASWAPSELKESEYRR